MTELVINPLAVPPNDFMLVFAEQLEPTLLAQGALYTMTGIAVDKDDSQMPIAISMTLWENMDAHRAFLESSAAQPFFETVKPLLIEKPTIDHYHLGKMHPSMEKSSHAWIHKFSRLDSKAYQEACENHIRDCGAGMAMVGNCIEILSQRLIVLFDNHPGQESALSHHQNLGSQSFRVAWKRTGTRKISENL